MVDAFFFCSESVVCSEGEDLIGGGGCLYSAAQREYRNVITEPRAGDSRVNFSILSVQWRLSLGIPLRCNCL